MEDPKPCPFCGCTDIVLSVGEPLVDHPEKRPHGYTCWKCLTHVPGGTSQETALKKWNTRFKEPS